LEIALWNYIGELLWPIRFFVKAPDREKSVFARKAMREGRL
jgi:hypothetical protein